MKVKISCELEDLFYKAWYYKKWAENCRNKRTKERLVKKAIKELNNVSREEVRKKIKVEF